MSETIEVTNTVFGFDEVGETSFDMDVSERTYEKLQDASKSRPSDDQVMLLIKEKTGATNSSAFQQLPDEIKRSILVELKGRRASLRQLERLTGIGKSMIYRM